ncbi:TetR/AcrR family transcriptional regulator [Edaphobacter albus]|uniref:TetR/AcrR family transcriptional regulator n=1 Tax=Edaphobacter sp. 4G125 TaxID=2763071 RepID=UPI0016451A06|nr:TetR/AcrR family transcriptional regulator [Edaphobacter sp. 4G125]QNI36905.1 TetR/AcrR family transcriptional regulator [Edaphobacter sp. 4G125]
MRPTTTTGARRGEKLREHILWIAKDVFLEMGFERASMDVVAARAETSKRSLYAHFESKEKLFLAVIELVRGLFLGRLKIPGDYSDKPAEALVMFCGRYLEALLYEKGIQMCRVSMAETARFPEGAAQYFDVLFTQVETFLSAYLKTTFGISTRASVEATHRLLGQTLYPHLPRALFGIDPLIKSLDREAIAPEVDLKLIRKAVMDLIESLPTSRVS